MFFAHDPVPKLALTDMKLAFFHWLQITWLLESTHPPNFSRILPDRLSTVDGLDHHQIISKLFPRLATTRWWCRGHYVRGGPCSVVVQAQARITPIPTKSCRSRWWLRRVPRALRCVARQAEPVEDESMWNINCQQAAARRAIFTENVKMGVAGSRRLRALQQLFRSRLRSSLVSASIQKSQC